MFKNFNPNALGFHASFHETIDLANLGGFEGIDLNIPEIMDLLKRRSVSDIKNLLGELRLGGWALPVDFRGSEKKYERDRELPTPEGCWLPASTTGLDPHPPRAQFPVSGNFPSSHVWKVGYGGLGLRRRNFGLPHPYANTKWKRGTYKLCSLSSHR
jgi:hypothetical protein